MDEENRNLFEEVDDENLEEMAEVVPQKQQKAVRVNIGDDEFSDDEYDEEGNLPNDDLVPILNDESVLEKEQRKGVKKAANARVLQIKEISFRAPVTKKSLGIKTVEVPPKQNKAGTGIFYYETKMKVKYHEDNLIEYYPGLVYFVNGRKLDNDGNVIERGVIDPKLKLPRDSNSKVAQMVRMALVHMAAKDGKNFVLMEAFVNEKKTNVIAAEDEKRFAEYSKTISDKAIVDYLIDKFVEITTTEGFYDGKKWFRNDWKTLLK